MEVKIFALTVPLRIIALQGSMPPFWIKEFVQTQGKRLKMNIVLRSSLESIYSELNLALDKGFLHPKSAMAADLVSLGDSWLGNAIQRGLIECIPNIEEQDWFMSLGNKWKVHLSRNMKGELDPSGNIWGVPYRWGTMARTYWKDFNDRFSKEVLGAVLKRMGASYNTKDIDLQVTGGRKSVLDNLKSLQRQVRLFDSMHYLKSFGAGDVWVAVGWSSDVIPQAKRMSNVAVVVPKSGTSIWSDLWTIPAATKFNNDRIGGRIRDHLLWCINGWNSVFRVPELYHSNKK
ncbi:hypothetical protein HPP92_014667 [Vanilla planifolia]|uniref:Uncharacterized protein n=1 Tax=Vanilla planifolia TaxID=51239 RepID=A0A835QKF4_VANPL|nr:hypothetical protein HPP92_014667 [Vanilla planifolia]